MKKAAHRIERKVDEARDALREAMSEVKKYEIAEANRVARVAQEEKSRESNLLDEIALQGFRRKGDAGQ